MMFDQLGLPVLGVMFVLGAVVILWSGSRLERLTDAIAVRTGMGHAFAGLLLLALVTSLPEVATTATAVFRGNVELAVANLLGGVAFQVVVLAIADVVARRGPLTGQTPSFAVLTQGVGLLAMLGVATSGLALGASAQMTGSLAGVPVNIHPVLLLLPLMYVAVAGFTLIARRSPRWQPVGLQAHMRGPSDSEARRRAVGRGRWLAFVGLAALVTLGGWATASSADLIAEHTGVSSGIIGATLLAAATSLPEISTTVAAARLNNHELAVSNVMGSNAFDVALLALVTVLSGDAFGVTTPALFMAGLGSVLTAVYVFGLLERSDRAVRGVGLDSLVVVTVYLAGVGALFGLS